MPRFAVINGTTVENVIVAVDDKALPGKQLVLLTTELVSAGDTYSNGVFTPRVVPATEQELNDASSKVAQGLALFRQWAGDAQDLAALTAMTAAQRLARQAVIEQRVAVMARALVYLARQSGISD